MSYGSSDLSSGRGVRRVPIANSACAHRRSMSCAPPLLIGLLLAPLVAFQASDVTEPDQTDSAAPGRDRAESRPLAFRGSERREVTPDNEIVDGRWIVIGNREASGGRVVRDADQSYKGSPVYRFMAADDSVNRIEFSELFGSADRLKGIPKEQVKRLAAIMAVDIGVDLGRYGDTVTYEWSTRFPARMGPETLGIFAQWHGRPDRTLVEDDKSVRMLTLAEFEELKKSVEFKEDGWGYDRKTGRRTACRVDAAAGGPIGEFRVGFNHLYLMVRSDASRRSSPDVKLKTRPTQEVGYRAQDGAKEASLVWKIPLSDVPVNEWLDFKVRIHFSEYDPEADRVLAPGSVSLWVNGKQVADWQGNIGQNDSLGPYFKFGIYKPGPGGFKVDHAAYRSTIERTRKSADAPNPLKDEVMRWNQP
jgi:heparin lyase